MNKRKGVPILFCNCVPEGWPISVGQGWTERDREAYKHLFCGCRMKWDSDPIFNAETQTLAGVCRNCNRPFYIRTEQVVRDVSVADPEKFREKSQHLRWADTDLAFLHVGMHLPKEAGVRKAHDNIQDLDGGCQHMFRLGYVQDLPSPSGQQTLATNSEAKRRFIKAIRRAERGGFVAADFPDWRPQASDEQFQQWTREIDRKLSKRGVIPDYASK